MRIKLSAYIAIQLVPSAWSRCPPVGSWALRSNTPILSRPRNPPWNTLRPSASLRLTHQVKLSISLWNTRSRNPRSPRPGLWLRSIWYTRHVIAEVLLAPDHAGKGLSLNAAGVDAGNAGLQVGVKFIGFADALGEHSVKVRERALDRAWRQAQLYGLRAARRNLEREPDGGLRAGLPRIDGMLAAGHDTFMDAVLPVTRPRIIAPQAAGIRFVVAEQDRPWRTVSVQVATSQLRVIDLDGDMLRHAQFRLVGPSVPTPGIAKPQLGQQVERGGLGSAVVRGDTHQDVFVAGLSVLDHHIEIPVVGEGLRVDELEFRIGDAAQAILLLQLRVRELPLRVLVKHLQIGVGRSGIEVVIELLDVFTIVSLVTNKSGQALLVNPILCVPQRQRQAQALLRVAEPADTILAPAVGATARVIVRKLIPGGAVLAVG